ncbi:hypothetical protein OS493_038040 [Desmophyllum pertusum]|uniref:Uncharacterized protein n=1 Tax=Desmophyllum pertusum TaxID=174260 RepID=A0A9W9YHJ2_9CNID|nr:hypothetical protein OS493_038040 [Desmophyllum pertusum]
MTGMAYMNDLNTANVLQQLWEKLPRYLRSKWTERVRKIRSTKERMANFSDFCQFVSEQADLATDPIYSEEIISRPKDARDKYRKQGKKVQASPQSSKHIAKFCKNRKCCQTCNKNHPTSLMIAVGNTKKGRPKLRTVKARCQRLTKGKMEAKPSTCVTPFVM